MLNIAECITINKVYTGNFLENKYKPEASSLKYDSPAPC